MTKILLLSATVFSTLLAVGQESANNQNSDADISRAKYMKISDSLNRSQSTTSQETYKAIDYLADKKEARDAEKQFRRELRMERARNNNYQNGYYRNYGTHYGYYSRPYFNRWSNTGGWRAIGNPFFWY